jgi:sugar phosphate isomerase/epimerase
MKTSQIAAQLYTVRDHCKTAADFTASIRKIRAIGYTAVQISGVGPIPPAEIRSICAGEGVTICATHEPGKTICETPQAVIDRLGALGCTYTAYPYPHVPISTIDEVEALAAALDKSGAALRKAGQVLCYHNHQHEFTRIGGRTVLETIYALTAPANLQGEPDTYWVQTGGGDPVSWCVDLCGRLPLLHLKDYAIRWIDGKPQVQMAEIGNGNLDWPAIIRAAEGSGCRWFIVEQDTCPADPFDSLRQSWQYLTTLAE